ncbi:MULTISPECIES: MOSC domain-containing protein [Cohnella]|uniref:MOSC domain-containing protein n=1 Tax=Cohnella TaxID=329857 RepID=UPI001594D118|nr:MULTISPECIES: MOSC domain-containing protein [Cohnella]MBN2983874.1 MOSC domain-containing protein [Cohnella algarum]
MSTATVRFPLLSVNVSLAETGVYKNKETKSGIFKKAVKGPTRLGLTGLQGDEQADLVNHGGPDRAICAYSRAHYGHWEKVLRRKLDYGAFGENFTLDRVTEADVCIGDVYALGAVKLQISQPRQPCWKLAMKWGLDELPALVLESGATGFYFRVLETGAVDAGELVLLDRPERAVTVSEVNRIMFFDKGNAEGIRRVLQADALSQGWKDKLSARLGKLSGEG